MDKKLAVVAVVYKNYDLLEDFLSSFEDQANNNYHLFISDLSSAKKTIKNNNLPLTVLESGNLGFAHGVNLALKEAVDQGFEIFCVINNDVFFKKDFVVKAFAALAKNPHSIIGGKIYYAPGFEYHKSRYKKEDLGKVLWYAGGEIDWEHMMEKHRGVDEVDQGQYDHPEETAFITGCLILFDQDVLNKVGFWNERFFLYYEDLDFCVRARKKGIKLHYDPSLVIWHKVSQSTGGSGSPLHQKYQSRNRVKIGLKYAPLRTKVHLLKNYFFDFFKKK
jgi:hypothetical protein